MRRSILTLAAACVVAVGAAFFLFADVASAKCGLGNCLVGGRATASLIVQHYDTTGVSDVPVEPDTGETFKVTAYWDVANNAIPSICSCRQTATATVTVDVDWNETTDSWDVTCTGCNAAGPIFGVSVCHVAGCGSHTTIDNAWEYELIVDLAAQSGFCQGTVQGELTGVDFDNTSIDDGDTITTATCSENANVSPTSQSFSATDNGPFECTFTCAAASGPTMLITYQ